MNCHRQLLDLESEYSNHTGRLNMVNERERKDRCILEDKHIALEQEVKFHSDTTVSMSYYKTHFEECARQNEILQKKITKINKEYENLRDHTEMMKNRFSSVEIEKDEIILAMKKAIEESDVKISELVSDDKLEIEALRKDYDDKLMTKDKELATLKRNLPTGMVINTDELFCMKRKVSSRNLTAVLDVTKCEGPSCNSTNVDMVKCIICSKFICEQCNNVPVTKLKNVMKKCSTIYFMCKLCDEADILTQGQEAPPPTVIVDDNQKVSTDSSSNTVSTFEKMILDKLQEIEERQNRFDETISMKFAEYYSNTKITEVNHMPTLLNRMWHLTSRCRISEK